MYIYIYICIFTGYRLCRRPLGLRNRRFDAWMLVFLLVWCWFDTTSLIRWPRRRGWTAPWPR